MQNAGTIQISEAYLRVIFSFTLQRKGAGTFSTSSLDASLHDLFGQTFKGPFGLSWTCKAPHNDYLNEYTPNIRGLLVHTNGGAGGRYYQLSPDANQWFVDTQIYCGRVPMESGNIPSFDAINHEECNLQISLANDAGFELFLTRAATGLLSFTIHIKPKTSGSTISARTLLTVQHGLANIGRHQPPLWFFRTNPITGGFESLNTPLGSRLTLPGGVFSWEELCKELLLPFLQAFDVIELQPRNESPQFFFPPRLAVNTVAVLAPNETSPSHDIPSSPIEELASSLCQVHHSSHPGEVKDALHADMFYVSKNHIVAISASGAAHLILHQQHAYDAQRVRRAYLTYATPFILAVAQRGILLRFQMDIATALNLYHQTAPAIQTTQRKQYSIQRKSRTLDFWNRRAKKSTQLELSNLDHKMAKLMHERQAALDALADIRYEIITTGLETDLVQASTRTTLQQFFEKTYGIFLISSALNKSRMALNDWDRSVQAKEQAKAAQHISDSIRAVEAVQGKLEWVEVLILSVYVVELSHIIAEGFHFPAGHVLGFSTSLLSIGSLALAYCILRPNKHRPANLRTTILVFILLSMVVLYIAVNLRSIHVH